MKIICAGGSGFIGSHLGQFFRKQGADLFILSRHRSTGQTIFWDVEKQLIDRRQMEGADVLINLAGENLFGLWTRSKRARIVSSRLQATALLKETLFKLKRPPTLYIGASAVGYYGDRGQELLTESSPPGKGFLSDLCQRWEALFQDAPLRTLFCRFGVVLGPEGPLERLALPFRAYLGGQIGDGEQFFSWIAIEDLAQIFWFLIQNPQLSGPLNCVSPHPVTNRELTEHLKRTLHRPAPLPLPAPLLRFLLGSFADEVLLASTRAVPALLERGKFNFQFPRIEDALKRYLG